MLELSLKCLSFLSFMFCVRMQNVKIPSVMCPNYFQYYFDNLQYIGKITIPTVSNSIDLMAHFSQRHPVNSNYYGRIVLETRNPLIYRVEFPTPREVPKLIKLTVNGKDICIQDPYPNPSTRIFLSHQLITQPLSSSLPKIQTQQYPTNNVVLQSFPVTSVQMEPTDIGSQFLQTINNRILNSTTGYVQPVQTFVEPVKATAQCGLGNVVTPLVFGGSEITRGEFPWLTAIYIKSAGLRFLCGGSLVSTKTVVSAGHCFKISSITASRLVVHLGRHNLEDFSEQGFVTREIQNLVVHPEYNSNLFPDADLAILHLKQSVKFSDHIRPICLWTDNSDSNFIVGEEGVVAGWGADEEGHTFTPIPKKVNSKIVSDGECLRSSAAYNMLTASRTFCAGNRDDTGPCMGDSGSSLMISRNGRWYLRGIVSAGQTKDRICNLKEFVVFCDVAKHLQWVQNNLIF